MILKKKSLFVLIVLATVGLLGNDLYCFITFGFDPNKHAFFVQAIAFAFFALCVYVMPDDKSEENEASVPDHAKIG